MAGTRRLRVVALLAAAALLGGSAVVVTAAADPTVASATPNLIPVPGTNDLDGIHCISASDCLVVGQDTRTVDQDGAYVQIVDGEDGGVQAIPGHFITIDAMACPTAGACFAVGSRSVYPKNPPDYQDGVVIPFVYGEVQAPIVVPDTNALLGIACVKGTRSCTAVGYEYDSTAVGEPDRYGTVVSLSDGKPTGAVQEASSFVTLNGVACPSPGSCLAVGITVPQDPENGVLPITGGVPGTTALFTGPAPAGFVTCPSPTQCWVGGAGDDELVPVDSGTPGTPIAATGLADVDTMACPTATQCYLGGQDTAGEAATASFVAGTVGPLQAVTTDDDTSILTMDCVSVKSCVAAGSGTDPAGGGQLGFVVTSPLASPAPTVTGATFSGSGYTTELTVTGTNLGSQAPAAWPADPTSCVPGLPVSYDYTSGVLAFTDTTGGWSAGGPGDCIGLIVKSWSNTKAVLEFGAAYVWPLVTDGDAFTVSVLGATYSSTATVPTVPAPVLDSVSIAGFGSADPTVTVDGNNFGTRVPLPDDPALPPTCTGDTGDQFPGTEVYFSDLPGGWTAGAGGNCLGIVVVNWSATRVVFRFGSAYQPDMGVGDAVEVGILGTTAWFTATDPSPPTITGLTVTGTKKSPVVTVTGSGLGSAPPAPVGTGGCPSADDSYIYPQSILYFEDEANGMQAGSIGCLGLVISSWSDTKAVLRMGSYYPHSGSVSKGDAVSMTILGSSFTATASV